MLERIGDIVYRLQLPDEARIHDVFHVGVLKPFRGTPPSSTPPLPPLRHGRQLQPPERVLRSELRRGVWHFLVEWAGMPVSEATWEPVPAFREAHPSFQLEDELFPKTQEGKRCYGRSAVPPKEPDQWLATPHWDQVDMRAILSGSTILS